MDAIEPTTASRKTIVACEVFADELQAVPPPEGDADFVWLPAALHTDIGRLEREIERTLLLCRIKGTSDLFVLYGGACSPSMDAILKKYDALRPEAGNCLDVLLGPLKTEAEDERAFVLTPGWVRAWPSIMKAMGWEAIDVRMNLGRYEGIIVYDAGIRPLTDEETIRFFDLTERYVDVRPLGLEHFAGVMKRLLNGNRSRAR